MLELSPIGRNLLSDYKGRPALLCDTSDALPCRKLCGDSHSRDRNARPMHLQVKVGLSDAELLAIRRTRGPLGRDANAKDANEKDAGENDSDEKRDVQERGAIREKLPICSPGKSDVVARFSTSVDRLTLT